MWLLFVYSTPTTNVRLDFRSSCKNMKTFVYFSKPYDSIHRGKMKQILLAYGLTNETVTDMMMHYKNTKVKFRSLD